MIAAFVLISAALTPVGLRMVHQARNSRVQAELELLHAAIIGDDRAGTFGYVGDLGRLPLDLSELASSNGLPLSTVSASAGVAYGWNGPYANAGRDASDFRTDPWGNAYDIGQAAAGQVRSAGPNGVFSDADDIIYPPNSINIFGSLLVTVKGISDAVVTIDPEGCVVTLHYSGEGISDSVNDDTVPYSFSAVHRGLHAVDVTCARLDGVGQATESAVVAISGRGAQQVVELFVDLGVAPGSSAGGAESIASVDAVSTQDGPLGGQR